jgi:hypothetical protein
VRRRITVSSDPLRTPFAAIHLLLSEQLMLSGQSVWLLAGGGLTLAGLPRITWVATSES